MKNFKLEAKGSLWLIDLETGSYSEDHKKDVLVVSANSEEEAWESLKVYMRSEYRNGYPMKGWWPYSYMKWNDKEYKFGVGDGDIQITITRLKVLYVDPYSILCEDNDE